MKIKNLMIVIGTLAWFIPSLLIEKWSSLDDGWRHTIKFVVGIGIITLLAMLQGCWIHGTATEYEDGSALNAADIAGYIVSPDPQSKFISVIGKDNKDMHFELTDLEFSASARFCKINRLHVGSVVTSDMCAPTCLYFKTCDIDGLCSLTTSKTCVDESFFSAGN